MVYRQQAGGELGRVAAAAAAYGTGRRGRRSAAPPVAGGGRPPSSRRCPGCGWAAGGHAAVGQFWLLLQRAWHWPGYVLCPWDDRLRPTFSIPV